MLLRIPPDRPNQDEFTEKELLECWERNIDANDTAEVILSKIGPFC